MKTKKPQYEVMLEQRPGYVSPDWLAFKLNEGWEVVAISHTGSYENVYLKRKLPNDRPDQRQRA